MVKHPEGVGINKKTPNMIKFFKKKFTSIKYYYPNTNFAVIKIGIYFK